MISKECKKLTLSDLLLYSSLFLLFNILCVVLLTSVLWFFGISITSAHYIIGVVISILPQFVLIKRNGVNFSIFPLSVLIPLIFTAAMIFISAQFFDYSFDSMAYHKMAIGLMADGWNPVSEGSSEFISVMNIFPDMNPDVQALWLDHYAKLPWIFSATLYKIVGNIEAVKILPAIMVFVTFSFTYAYTKTKWAAPLSLLFSFAAALTPVVFTQFFTFYIDGILASSLTVLVILLVMITDGKCHIEKSIKWISLFIIIAIITNIKFTGLAYAAVFSLVFYIFWLACDLAKKRFNKSKTIKITAFFAIAVVFSLCIVGYSTYVKNTIEHGFPLYPLMGENSVDIMKSNQPDSFAVRSPKGKLFLSTFSESSNKVKDEPKIKNPFTFTKKELDHYCADTRISGFGVLYGAIIIISAVSFVFSLPFLYYKNKKMFLILLMLLLTTSALLLLISDSWWARYSPHYYFIPLTALFVLIDIAVNRPKNIIKFISSSSALILAGFILFNLGTYFYKYITMENDFLYEQLDETKNKLSGKSIELYINNRYYVGVLYNLRDFGIDFYVSRTELPNSEKIPLECSNITYRIINQD